LLIDNYSALVLLQQELVALKQELADSVLRESALEAALSAKAEAAAMAATEATETEAKLRAELANALAQIPTRV